MSWWDSKGLANFATKALQKAQHHIDKALDIQEDSGEGQANSSLSAGFGTGDDFWGSYLGADAAPSTASKPEPKQTKPKPSTEDDLFASLSSPSTDDTDSPSPSTSLLTQKAKSLQDKLKASSKRSFISEYESAKSKSEDTSQSDILSKPEPEVQTEKQKMLPLSADTTFSPADRKTSPLKLGMKLGAKKKEKERAPVDKGNFETSYSSAEIEAKLQREKEAERQLAEMLGGSEPSPHTSQSQKTWDQPAVATLDISEETTPEMDKSISESKTDSAGSFLNTSDSLGSGLGMFDMSGSSIMQDSQCGEWGEDVSLSVLMDSSTMSLSDTKQKTETDSEKDGISLEVSNTKKEIDSPNTTEIHDSLKSNLHETVTNKPGETSELQSESVKLDSNLESQSQSKEQSDTDVNINATETDASDQVHAINQENGSFNSNIEIEEPKDNEIAVTVTQSSETTADTHNDEQTLTDSVIPPEIIESPELTIPASGEQSTDIASDDLDQSDINVISDKLQRDTLLDTSFPQVLMDESQASSADDLSSSNRTLTADDLQSMDNSQGSSVNNSEDKTESEILSEKHQVLSEVPESDTKIVEEAENSCEVSKADDNDQSTQDENEVQEKEISDQEKCDASSNSTAQAADSVKEQTEQGMAASQTSELSASSSMVKCMLEEAMTESVKDSCDSHSHSSSDMVRIESGGNSEHTSADELETATSSDIEIISHISTPTGNGPNGGIMADRPYDLSPLRQHAYTKTGRRCSPPGHNRTDSGSSGYSIQGRNGDDVIPETRRPEVEHMRRQHKSNTQQSDPGDKQNNPYETEKLLKTSSDTSLEPITETGLDQHCPLDSNRLLEKLADMAEVLEAREKKLVELSRHNMDLTESNSILKNQLQQSEEAREAELTDLNQLTEEFTQRISEAERKLQQATKERDQLKKHSSEMESLLTKRSDTSANAQKLLSEKDQQIAELMEEGEKLSKQQLQVNNIIKKLRSKEKENDAVMKTQKEKIESQKAEIERLKKVLDNKCDVEKQQGDSINQLQAAVQRYEKELEKYKIEQEESSDKLRSLQAALDNSYKEIAELHKANVMKASQLQENKLSSEIQAKQELQIQLDRQVIQAKQEHEALLNQIEDLRLSMSRLEKEGGRREDILRQEISDLQQRLQEAEERNQELTQGVTAATRPLLRQIENLQSTYAAQSSSYERVEKNLTERLNEAQLSLATAQEKERVASEQLMEVTTRLTTLETQLAALRQEKSKLQAQLEMEKTKVEVLEDAKNNASAQREALQHTFEQEISQLKRDKLLLENQYEMEKIRVEAEKKKNTSMTEQLRDKEMQIANMLTSRSSTPKDGLLREPEAPMFTSMTSMSNSMSASFFSTMGEDTMDKSFVVTPNGSKASLYETLRHTGAATLMENLQAQVKQQDGEIVQLQNEIRELEKSRESMARELVTLSNTNAEQGTQLEEYEQLKKKYKELDQRYNALLQMYGEKEEEVQELRLDLSDIKDLYKSQIDELLAKR